MAEEEEPAERKVPTRRRSRVNVVDLEPGEPDAAGNELQFFYARKPPEYAVYQTRERVAVHFADADDQADEQRRALAQLAPLRGELNGLVDGWRQAPKRQKLLGFGPLVSDHPDLRKRAARYDRRVGDALIVAFEGDLTGAGAVLQDIKEEVLDERIGSARFDYLRMALIVAVGFVVLASIVAWIAESRSCSLGTNPLCFSHANDLWRGAMAGALGAFFSIALAIRGRTVLPDLNRTSNLMDAALRVAIGIIAGMVLVALVLAEFVRLTIGDSSPNQAGDLYIGITGFVAGFAERLVPDLLAKADARTGERPVLRKPEPDLDAMLEKQRQKEKAATAPTAPEATQAAAPVEIPDEEGHEDGCIADVEPDDDELTRDEMLPAASGGVDRADGRIAA